MTAGNITINFTDGGRVQADEQFVATWSPSLRPRPPAITLPENAATVLRPKADKRARRPHEWYRIENAASEGDAADVWIYDEISDPFMSEFFGIGISAAGFVSELQRLKGSALNVHVNSPGGSVFEGLAIYNALRAHTGPVNVIVDGIAASIASVIAMSGDTVTMAPHSMLMIHDAWGITVGNAADHEQQALVLNKLSDNIAGVYAERGDKRVNWRHKMLAETWLTDAEAVSLGLADRIDTQATPAQNSFDLSRFRNAPADLAPAESAEPTRTERDAERALRDAGFSRKDAETILARGWVTLDAAEIAAEADTDPDAGGGGVPAGETDAAAEIAAADPEQTRIRRQARARELALLGALLD